MVNLNKVKEIIDAHHNKTGGGCGMTIPDVRFKTELEYTELNPILKKLMQDKYFKIRKGINGYLIFKV